MPAPPPQPPATILLLGALRTWPDPLPQLVTERLIDLHAASGPHQAAALLKDQGRFLALLVDPEHLSRRELRMMITVKRHAALPIWSLPTRHRKALISELGIIPWEDASRVLSRYVPQGLTPQAAQNDAPKSRSAVSSSPALPPPPPPPPKAHNPPENAREKRAEIPVATHLADRYDQNDATPLLSELELRALLGSADE
jgi:hypothetical protein